MRFDISMTVMLRSHSSRLASLYEERLTQVPLWCIMHDDGEFEDLEQYEVDAAVEEWENLHSDDKDEEDDIANTTDLALSLKHVNAGGKLCSELIYVFIDVSFGRRIARSCCSLRCYRVLRFFG